MAPTRVEKLPNTVKGISCKLEAYSTHVSLWLSSVLVFRWLSSFLSDAQGHDESVSKKCRHHQPLCVVSDTNIRQDLKSDSEVYFLLHEKSYIVRASRQQETKGLSFSLRNFIKIFKRRHKRKLEWSNNVKSKHLISL